MIIIRILLIIITLILILGLLILAGSLDTKIDDADYAIVLGHALKDNKADKVLTNRLELAVKYFNFNKDCRIICSGGITGNNTVSEAQVMYDYLVEDGVDESRIIKEDKSTNTIENFENSTYYIGSSKQIIVISSNYHIFRSKMILKLLGYKSVGLGAKTPFIKLVKHLAIEIVYIPKNFIDIKKKKKSL